MSEIKLQNLTPTIYYNQSRDFQFIGRLFDVVLNSVKTNADSLYSLPLSDNSDPQLIDLMTMTLGFKSKHNYNIKQLTALCSAFTKIIKVKGSLNSIKMAIDTLLNAEGISETATCTLTNDNTVLELFIPQNLTDINLLKDLLNYILPAGVSCNIIKEIKITKTATTEINTSHNVIYYDESGSTHSTGKGATIVNTTDTQNTSIIIQAGESGEADENIHDTAGASANSWLYIPESGGN